MVSILRKSQIAVAMLAVVLVMDLSSDHAAAQFLNTSAVGGVAIDVDGLVSAPTVEQQQELLQIRKTAIEQAPADLMAFTELRAVSLRGLEAAIAKHLKTNEPAPRGSAMPGRAPADSLRAGLPRAKRHRACRSRRGLGNRRTGQRGRCHHRSAGFVAR